METQNQPNSLKDVVLMDSDGRVNLIDEISGKVTLFANVTGHCGNAEQYGILEKVYQRYKDRGFEVVAVPTNDYCGAGVTYGKYENGIAGAKDAEEYGRTEWNVTYPFSEMVVSREARDGEEAKPDVHPLYKTLNPEGEKAPMNGNFEKFLVDRNGVQRVRKANGVLLSWAHRDGYCESPEQEYENLCKDIENLLEEE